VNIEYSWIDVTGASQTRSIYVSGDPVAYDEGMFGRIPSQIWSVILGVITGALIAIIPALIDKRRQKQMNRQHVRGLLYLMAMQSEHSVRNGIRADPKPLETIFETERLSTIVQEEGVAQEVHNLWRAIQNHNTGLNSPGGARRSTELREAAEALTARLNRGSWIRRLGHWVKVTLSRQ
jgi:hypothetical protein